MSEDTNQQRLNENRQGERLKDGGQKERRIKWWESWTRKLTFLSSRIDAEIFPFMYRDSLRHHTPTLKEMRKERISKERTRR